MDVNVLIALIDSRHVFHDRAHRWFLEQGRACWASCPMTENGLLRIVGHGRYPNSPGSPAAVVPSLQSLRQLGDWQFWPDDLILTDSELIDANRLASSAQVTDTYLLALAVARGGELATFDARLVTTAVKGGDRALHLVA